MSAGGPLHQALTVAACAGQVFPTAKPLRKPAPGILPRASQSSADGFVFRARPSSTRAPTAYAGTALWLPPQVPAFCRGRMARGRVGSRWEHPRPSSRCCARHRAKVCSTTRRVQSARRAAGGHLQPCMETMRCASRGGRSPGRCETTGNERTAGYAAEAARSGSISGPPVLDRTGFLHGCHCLLHAQQDDRLQ